MERNKSYQFCLNTANNCFLCLGEIIVHNALDIKYSSIQNIFRYLEISLKFNSLSKKSMDILNKPEVRVKLCGECDSILESFSKHSKALELARMGMEHELIEIQKRLKTSKKCNSNENDIKTQNHSKLVEEIRIKMDRKCQYKMSRIEEPRHAPDELEDNIAGNLNQVEVQELQEDPLEVFYDESEDVSNLMGLSIGFTKQMQTAKEGPTKCSICGKIFPHWRALARHKVRHNLVKRYSCKQCLKSFHYKAELSRHVRSHTKEKPHKCPFCPNRFGERGNLHQHVRDVHNKALTPGGIKLFQCKYCEKVFKHKKNIQMHLRGKGCSGLRPPSPVALPSTVHVNNLNVKSDSGDK